ncbi:MAG TPA: hypothetical protein VHX61_20400 [Rhizomicrobium sp.]|jgi:hypothetical protein|nr:hypothetical protein [Rhizomicrobium sp.]
MGWMSRIYYHAYQDIFMGSRIDAYRTLLRRLKEYGYRFCTMTEFILEAGRNERSGSPVCLLRNDIDSDPAGAAQMFACDREEGVRASYFFRLTTFCPALMKQIAAQGGDVGYHFEEIATVAKRLGLRSRPQVDARLDAIRAEFRSNVLRFGARAGLRPRMVASHGDFINRRIGVSNQYLLTRPLMDELGIIADAYDERVHASLDARFSDWPAPRWWQPADPVQALRSRPATVSILVHPRQWTCNPVLNIRLAAARIVQESAWRWSSAMTARRTGPLSLPAGR